MKLEPLLKRSHFTPDEIKVAVQLEKIIFTHNLTIHHYEKRAGATFNDIKKGLSHIGSEMPDDYILELLNKLEKFTINERLVPILTKVNNKWYSNC